MRDWLNIGLAVLCQGCLLLLIWAWAHGTVATECERLGAFHVGYKVYECKIKELR